MEGFVFRLLVVVLFMVSVSLCKTEHRKIGFSSKAANQTSAGGGWMAGKGTWYGSPSGAGTDKGACGYGSLPNTAYGSNIIAMATSEFDGGSACGRCYSVKCVNSPNCKETATTVVVTDTCPECESNHLDFSGAAFQSMAKNGLGDALRTDGIIQIQYRRSACSFPKQNIAFEVAAGTNEFWKAFVVKYVPGAGEVSAVQVRPASSPDWQDAVHDWGCVWNARGPLKTPVSVKITTSDGTSHVCQGGSGIRSWAIGETSTCNT